MSVSPAKTTLSSRGGDWPQVTQHSQDPNPRMHQSRLRTPRSPRAATAATPSAPAPLSLHLCPCAGRGQRSENGRGGHSLLHKSSAATGFLKSPFFAKACQRNAFWTVKSEQRGQFTAAAVPWDSVPAPRCWPEKTVGTTLQCEGGLQPSRGAVGGAQHSASAGSGLAFQSRVKAGHTAHGGVAGGVGSRSGSQVLLEDPRKGRWGAG